MGVNFTSRQAYAIALKETGLNPEDAGLLSTKKEGGMYVFLVEAQEMLYEFYVGSEDGYVYGINIEPSDEETCDLAYDSYHGHQVAAA